MASANTDDLKSALRTADIVHVAAHGSPTAIALSDGDFTADDVPRNKELKARLVILSACETLFCGNEEQSIVWWLVRNGCSVIATQRAVDDQACRWFFEALYADLLPGPKVGGRYLSTAIQAASDTVLGRVARLTDENARDRILRSLSAFVLYGDPTMHLELTFRRGAND